MEKRGWGKEDEEAAMVVGRLGKEWSIERKHNKDCIVHHCARQNEAMAM